MKKLERDLSCEVLVVGAGITGSLTAQHLASRGRRVCVIDRGQPALASTAASTAMLQWEIDCSLVELTEIYGFERAASIYQRSVEAVAGLKRLVAAHNVDCAFRARSSLFICGAEESAKELLEEHQLRQRAALPGDYLDHSTLMRAFHFDRAAAICSPGCAEANPLALSQGLLALAQQDGAGLFEAEAVEYSDDSRRVAVGLANGHVIEADHVVLATGYVMPAFVETKLHQTAASWAICTRPQEAAKIWRDKVLIWESAEPYLYLRTLPDNSIVAGGEDESGAMDQEQRDRLTPAKARIIRDKLIHLVPGLDPEIASVWSGEFGETHDGLPLIGPVPGHPRILAAYGYGGNGITFSYLASRMIERLLCEKREQWFEDFALDRG